jgi:hypothetical protein
MEIGALPQQEREQREPIGDDRLDEDIYTDDLESMFEAFDALSFILCFE